MLFTRDLCSRWGGGQRPGAPGLAGCVLRERSWDGALLARREKPPAPDRRAPRVGVSESNGKSFRAGLCSVTRRDRELQEQVGILLGMILEGQSRRLGWGATASVWDPWLTSALLDLLGALVHFWGCSPRVLPPLSAASFTAECLRGLTGPRPEEAVSSPNAGSSRAERVHLHIHGAAVFLD